MATEMTMFNVRMNRELKNRGNTALEKLGVTPSQLIRALWGILADDEQDGAKQVEVLVDTNVWLDKYLPNRPQSRIVETATIADT